MQTIIIVLNPSKLENPDLDLRYHIPDRIEKISNGAIQDNGYDYIDTEDGQPGPLMGIWLETESAAENWPMIIKLFQTEMFMGNDLSVAAEIFISENDTEDIENCTLVWNNAHNPEQRSEEQSNPDSLFDHLSKEDESGWQTKQSIDFGGNTITVDVLIQGDAQTGITDRQKKAFTCFMKKWPKLQAELIEALIQYYNEEERFSYGPDDEEEAAEWWPEIETEEALLQSVTLETIVVAEDFMMDDGRHIYLLFSRTWGGEDLDDNGIGVCYVDEKIDEIGYKDIAF